jgi:hypothetical protein
MIRKGIVLATMILAAVAGALVPLVITSLLFGLAFFATTLPTGNAESGPDPREEYYRAIYDLCMSQVGQADFCLEQVEARERTDWYEQPSPGWEWPPAPAVPGQVLPEATPQSRPQQPQPQHFLRSPAGQGLNG